MHPFDNSFVQAEHHLYLPCLPRGAWFTSNSMLPHRWVPSALCLVHTLTFFESPSGVSKTNTGVTWFGLHLFYDYTSAPPPPSCCAGPLVSWLGCSKAAADVPLPSHLPPALCGTKMAAPQMSPKFCHWRSCAARTLGDIFSLAHARHSGDNWQCADGAEVSGLRLFCSIVTEMSTNRNSGDMSPLPAQCSSSRES